MADDWGPVAFDGGDYPVIGDVAAPSAPGKRAKRTFNKQQYTLDAMAAGTVTLDRPKDQERSEQASGGTDTPGKVDTKKRKATKASKAEAAVHAAPASSTEGTTDVIPAKDEGKKRKRDKKAVAEVSQELSTEKASKSAKAKPAEANLPAAAVVKVEKTAAVTAEVAVADAPAVFLKKQRNKFLPAFGKLVEAPVQVTDAKAALSKAQRKYKEKAEAKEQAATHVGAPVVAAQLPPPVAREGQPGPTRAQKKKAKWDAFKAQQAGGQQVAAAAGVVSAEGQPARTKGAAFSPGAVKFPSNADKKWAKKQAKMALAATEQSQQEQQSEHAQQAQEERPSTQSVKETAAPAAAAAAAPALAATEIAAQSKLSDRSGKRQRVGADEPAQMSEPQARTAPTNSTRNAGGLPATTGGSNTATGGGSQLLDKMRAQLQGGRFRWLNEQLYTTLGEESFDLLQAQPDLYQQYHEGFRQQTAGWPRQPVDSAIEWLKSKPSDWVVADFGCGDAKIAATVPQTVHSFDLVSGVPGVVACNMAAVPLKDDSVDVAVFCLALMGTDYGAFLQEAARVMRKGGWLWIAEVRSRFAGTVDAPSGGLPAADSLVGEDGEKPKMAKAEWVNLAFQESMKQLGFKLASRDVANKMFVIMQFRKGNKEATTDISWPELKACVYKKR